MARSNALGEVLRAPIALDEQVDPVERALLTLLENQSGRVDSGTPIVYAPGAIMGGTNFTIAPTT